MVSAEVLLWAILGVAIACSYMLVWGLSMRRRLNDSLMPGWWCPNPKCRLFNGDAKVRLQNCRGCDTPRP